MIGAFAFLILTTTRNRLQSQLRRLRSPRYAFGLAVGLFYFWSVFFRRSMRPPAGPSPFLGATAESLAPLLIVLVVSGIWLFGGDRSALAFTEAEVAMLLTAPVSRRALIVYKIARSQIAILLNAAIWVYLLRRGSSALPGALSALAIWLVFTTLSLHRMGAALARASQVEHRAAGKRRNWAGRVLGLVVVLALLAPVYAARAALSGSPDPFAFLGTLARILSGPAARIVLYPFHVVIAPVFAHDAGEWAAAMLPALGLALLHVWWVLRSDAAFEEAAAEASAAQAKRIAALRARNTTGPAVSPKAAARTFALASTGRPSVAIVWKNAFALLRTFQGGALLRLLIVAVLVSFAFAWTTGDAARITAIMSLVLAAVLLLFGSRFIRNDLRSDMLHLPFLKSLPIRGAELVLAEVASGAVPMAVVQLLLVTIAGSALAMSSGTIGVPAGVQIAVLIASPIWLIALNGAMFTVLNGTAVLFPAWIQLGPAGPGGVEVMGQTLIATVGSMLVLVLLLVIPALLGAVGFYMVRSSPAAGVVVACVVGGIVLALESYAMIVGLGRAFERAEPQQVT